MGLDGHKIDWLVAISLLGGTLEEGRADRCSNTPCTRVLWVLTVVLRSLATQNAAAVLAHADATRKAETARRASASAAAAHSSKEVEEEFGFGPEANESPPSQHAPTTHVKAVQRQPNVALQLANGKNQQPISRLAALKLAKSKQLLPQQDTGTRPGVPGTANMQQKGGRPLVDQQQPRVAAAAGDQKAVRGRDSIIRRGPSFKQQSLAENDGQEFGFGFDADVKQEYASVADVRERRATEHGIT